MPFLTDTHAHLYSKQFDSDREAMVQRARDAGVGRILLPNIDRASTDALWRTVEMDPELFLPMMGVHPCHVKEDYEQELAHVESELRTGRYIAVGEIGIDLYWEKDFIAQQVEAFEQQMRWAKELKLPIAIHCRDAFEQIFTSLEREQDGTLTGVLHCFTGSAAQAERCIALGMLLGIGGVATFKNGGVAEAIADIGMEHLLLETDAPYLAPIPHRGKRNETAFVRLVAEKVADIKGMDVDEVARITSANAARLFHL
ncbi:MAG: TatD family hydrolase [Flavobacteriales bacterium]|nr:TatD family hydrolase [Flavobacteriales bacterium]